MSNNTNTTPVQPVVVFSTQQPEPTSVIIVVPSPNPIVPSPNPPVVVATSLSPSPAFTPAPGITKTHPSPSSGYFSIIFLKGPQTIFITIPGRVVTLSNGIVQTQAPTVIAVAPTQPASSSNDSSSTSTGVIVGAVIGSVLGVALLIFFFWYWHNRKSKKDEFYPPFLTSRSATNTLNDSQLRITPPTMSYSSPDNMTNTALLPEPSYYLTDGQGTAIAYAVDGTPLYSIPFNSPPNENEQPNEPLPFEPSHHSYQ